MSSVRNFELKPLPYAKDALAPWISARTVEFHYEKHHRGYVEKLNGALDERSRSATTLEGLVRAADGEVYQLAAQVWNHDFYWRGLRSGGGGKPAGRLLALVEASFSDFGNLQRRLAEAASSHFGSGWAWLVVDEQERLCVTATHDADNPLREGLTPLLTIDVWEHAYYLDVQSERDRYVEAVIDHLIDWDFVLRNLDRAVWPSVTGAEAVRRWSSAEEKTG